MDPEKDGKKRKKFLPSFSDGMDNHIERIKRFQWIFARRDLPQREIAVYGTMALGPDFFLLVFCCLKPQPDTATRETSAEGWVLKGGGAGAWAGSGTCAGAGAGT